jgi:hypothetical protein
MRKSITVCAILGAFSVLGLAEDWNGTLVDYNCMRRGKSVEACGAKPSTDVYMLYISKDKQLRFDNASNDRARMAMQSRADRASNPDATKATPVYVKVTGNVKEDGKVHANTIEVQ